MPIVCAGRKRVKFSLICTACREKLWDCVFTTRFDAAAISKFSDWNDRTFSQARSIFPWKTANSLSRALAASKRQTSAWHNSGQRRPENGGEPIERKVLVSLGKSANFGKMSVNRSRGEGFHHVTGRHCFQTNYNQNKDNNQLFPQLVCKQCFQGKSAVDTSIAVTLNENM